ncbi:MAG: redoxin domain-containing protein [Lentisphaerae bacterium]|nr:redoxin domain-containing protein [Lentisphaerota bacterium]MBT4816644.1 redoxin domain-containing protein [Lentisphaerota bacterium]MBT5610063.1 redoxin domain-containing protein [Lentisphaerota bacterium]MBT7055537.1 redoxin domain-containing protein [Lentisphaerota bacterium]MBT7841508.1 redoxin domain-containing protein [Lentisphaerota bacterium]
MRAIRTLFFCGLIACLGMGCAGSAWLLKAEPDRGESFPDLGLPLPKEVAECAELGLPAGEGEFRLGDIAADIVVVEVFDMYCRYCQEGAPQAAELSALSSSSGKKAKVRMIGIALGNSDYEVALFKSKHNTPFPVFADNDGRYHRALGARIGRPSFYALRLDGERNTILETQSGLFTERSPGAFLERALGRAGF